MSSPSDWQRPVEPSVQGRFVCLKCGFRSHQDQKCPRCGIWSLRSPEKIRKRGAALIVLGIILTAGLGLIIVISAVVILQMPASGITPAGVWNFATVASVLLSFLLMSILLVIEGVYQVATKRATKWIVKAATWQFLFFAALAAAVRIGVRIYMY
jgi:ribosomal protein L40E